MDLSGDMKEVDGGGGGGDITLVPWPRYPMRMKWYWDTGKEEERGSPRNDANS